MLEQCFHCFGLSNSHDIVAVQGCDERSQEPIELVSKKPNAIYGMEEKMTSHSEGSSAKLIVCDQLPSPHMYRADSCLLAIQAQ
jgi:hypothetical protein